MIDDATLRTAVLHVFDKYDIKQNHLARFSEKSSGSLSQILKGGKEIQLETKRIVLLGLHRLLHRRRLVLDARDDHEASLMEASAEIGLSAGVMGFSRQMLDPLIDRYIEDATQEVVFLGGISQRRMSQEWYRLLAKALAKGVHVSLFIESPQQLFWRSLSLDEKVDDNCRDYGYLRARHNIQRSEMPSQIAAILKEMERNSECGVVMGASELLLVREVDIPIYTFITKIDDTFVIVPRSHLRASLSCAEIVLDKEDSRWKQANDYVSFCQRLADEGRYIDYPGTDKLSVYSDNGHICRGEMARRSFRVASGLETRVIHGLIFNRRGEMMLRFRERDEYDNKELWDKSFGGNVEVEKDASLRNTAARELHEEVFDGLVRRLTTLLLQKQHPLPFAPPKEILECGPWRSTEGLKIFQDMRGWLSFLVRERERFPSIRLLEKSGASVKRILYADIYVFICDDEFHKFTDGAASACPEVSTCRWIRPSALHEREDATPDLCAYVVDFASVLADIEMAIVSTWPEAGSHTRKEG